MKTVEKIAVTLVLCIAIAGFAYAGFGTVSVTTTETEVAPAKADRSNVLLQNNTTNDIWIKYDGSTNALTTNNGIKLVASGGSIAITKNGFSNPARNRITAISAAGTNALTYSEGNEN
jgi:agmatine/peptidylarginine deiminase